MSPTGTAAMVQMASDATFIGLLALYWRTARRWRLAQLQEEDSKWNSVRQKIGEVDAKGQAASCEDHAVIEQAVRARLKETHEVMLRPNPYHSHMVRVFVGYLVINAVLLACCWRALWT